MNTGHDGKIGGREVRSILRVIAAVGFIAAGANHFLHREFYQRMIPPGFASPATLVFASGFFEITGGIGLLITGLRKLAGWGLIALLIAVFPANLYMAISSDRFADLDVPYWLLILRLPLQAVLVAWVWWVGSD